MKHYLDYVNVLQGTDSTERFSNGNTLPLTQRPYGMISFSPQTQGGNNWWFDPHSHTLEGIRLTHQPSPWIGDYGTLLITPQADVISDTPCNAWTGTRRHSAVLRPDYLKLEFIRADAALELTVTPRCGIIRARYQSIFPSCVSIFNLIGRAHFELHEKKGEISGFTDGYQCGKAENFRMYFSILPLNGWIDWPGCRIVNNDAADACIHLARKDQVSQVVFLIGISYISQAQARQNCQEAEGKSFEALREEAAQAWEDHLAAISITAPEEDMKTFYSCMYRTGLFPHTAHETDVDGRTVHYSPHTGKIHPGVRYTDQGFWDTSRTLLPLFSLIRRDLYADIVESALNDYRESGWLPKWISPGETGGMPGTLIDSVLAQAATRRLTAPDTLKEILAAMRHHADHQAPENRFGRHGVEDYLHLGYVPGDRYSESVNLTLDYAYGDYCIARVAALLKDTRTSQEYLVRSENYKSLFDSQSGFMRARTAAGEFVTPFDPCCWGRDYTEACAWQTTFQVPHDLPGLAELMGGKATLLQKLDQIFEQKPIYRVGGYGKEIHEMTEMAAADYGLCAISNQPSFLLPYLYACFGEEEKTIYWVDRICREAFHSGPDGFPGDEDNGSMAAWYLLSCIGLYPVCPADDTWIKIPARFSGTIYGESIETFKERERTYGNSDSLFQKR